MRTKQQRLKSTNWLERCFAHEYHSYLLQANMNFGNLLTSPSSRTNFGSHSLPSMSEKDVYDRLSSDTAAVVFNPTMPEKDVYGSSGIPIRKIYNFFPQA
ncbi:hypothetical protein KFK09_015091 [Dendrobium nobile]|uniref:Uncharacterized protein n=1 Tax=Dendrobium nobile TaxID=94219 RepID=A0A8T3B690_DENNO|nr:hypothetical protein KFK09_015091 [Dendrobium nobile]